MNIREFVAELRDAPYLGQPFREALARERAEGREEGLAEALRDGRRQIFTLLLRSYFGEGTFILPLAQILAGWNDEQAAIDLIEASATPDALHKAIQELPDR